MILGRCDGCGAPLDEAALSGETVRCGYCQRASRAKATRRPANATTERRAHATTESYSVGQHVMVEWHGSEWFATVTKVAGDGRWTIHFDGYSSTWDETVGPDRIRPATKAERARRAAEEREREATSRIGKRIVVAAVGTIVAFGAYAWARQSFGIDTSAIGSSLSALVAGDTASAKTAPPASDGPGADYRARKPAETRSIGDLVRVEWNGRWYDAHVIGTPSPTTTRIHYDGWSDSWDEDVEDARLRVHRGSHEDEVAASAPAPIATAPAEPPAPHPRAPRRHAPATVPEKPAK